MMSIFVCFVTAGITSRFAPVLLTASFDAGSLFGLFFDLEAGGDAFLGNAC
jgi:hypothetical protein